jgi:hypothetical protein
LEASGRLPPGGAWPDPTGWVCPPAILNVTVPPGLTYDLGRLPPVGGAAVDLLAALGLAEGGAAEQREAGASDVKQWQAQLAYRAWRWSVDGIDGLASNDLCCVECVAFQREKGPTPDRVVGRAPGR